jgi:hypothetical protein
MNELFFAALEREPETAYHSSNLRAAGTPSSGTRTESLDQLHNLVSMEDAALAAMVAKLADRPTEAVLDDDELVCTCGNRERPQFVAVGYDLTHKLISISPEDGIVAESGWSEGFCQEGTGYVLQCAKCFGYALPKDMGVDFE